MDRACGSAGFRHRRTETTSGLCGTVLEIGFESGLNVDYYPPDVNHVMAVERDGVAWADEAGCLMEARVRTEKDRGGAISPGQSWSTPLIDPNCTQLDPYRTPTNANSSP